MSRDVRRARVLFFAYYFPPIGGGGVQRSLKFVRYLAELGYDATVVAGPAETHNRWTPRDGTLCDEIPAGTDVRHVAGLPPAPRTGWRDRAERWLDLETPFARWWIERALDAGRRAGSRADVIFASMSPYESGIAAATLAKELGKPWVADLRDPWALDEMSVYPTAVHRRLDVRRMREVLSSASAVVMNTPEAERELRKRLPELGRKLVATIPNGFDAEDFAEPPPERADDAFRIVHTGYLHTDLAESRRRKARVRRVLGGADRIDVLARSHVYLLEAVERILRLDPALASRLELHLAGVLSDSDRRAIRSRVVRTHGYLPHSDALALVRSADLLFLPMHDLAGGTRARIVPGKTYEYLASERPILAAVPDGDARDLLAGCEGVTVCRPSDVAAMARVIAERVREPASSRRVPAGRIARLARYERRRLAGELADVFETVLARRETGVPRAGARRADLLEPSR